MMKSYQWENDVRIARCHTPYILLGKSIDEFTREQLLKFWSVTAKHVTKMYKFKVREGIR